MHLLNILLAGKKLDGNKLRQDKLLEYKISLANINKYLANISNTIDSKPKKKVKKKKKSK